MNIVRRLYSRLTQRGYKPTTLTPLFREAFAFAHQPANPNPPSDNSSNTETDAEKDKYEHIILHLPFHPDNPSSKKIQHSFQELMSHPPGETPLPKLRNHQAFPSGIQRLIVAYHRPKNLRDLLFPRKFCVPPGLTVSALCNET